VISLVVPAYNEERFLPRLLDSVDVAIAAWRGPRADLEVVVADNQSTDATPRIAAERGCRVVATVPRTIAATRNAGARAARGDRLAFVDADARVHPDTFNEIARLLDSGRVVGGASGVTMDRWSPGIALTYAMLLPMVWLTGFDTGVTFCRREDFEAVGGYDEELKFAEDVKFLFELWRRGRRTGRRVIRARRIKAVYSTRKFDDHGDWHYFGLLWRGLTHPFGGGRMDEMADRYWYKPHR
jgi:glycosyltransferase involved in cell wall biosynthesis